MERTSGRNWNVGLADSKPGAAHIVLWAATCG